MRRRDFLFIPAQLAVTVAGLLWGGQSTFISVRNRAPVELTCAEFEQHRPDAEWLRLSHCEVGFDSISFESFQTARDRDLLGTREPSVMFMPMRSSIDTPRPSLLLDSDDDDLLAVAKSTDLQPTPPAVIARVRARFAAPLEGLVRRGITNGAKRRAEVRELHVSLSDDFAMFELGAKPRPLWLSLGALVLGLGALSLLLDRMRGGKLPRAIVAK